MQVQEYIRQNICHVKKILDTIFKAESLLNIKLFDVRTKFRGREFSPHQTKIETDTAAFFTLHLKHDLSGRLKLIRENTHGISLICEEVF